ncbi:MAG: type II CRISPR-associated endonuclease Cas1 [Hyphomicrobiaceae bacterium]|nr:MAG: type II CRISPR-associated endonuclease Cas1 [Hyphomicrobiaceae bacterium]
MAWRGVHLTRPARLSLADQQIVIAQDDGEVRLPIEDVGWVILDTQQVSITGRLLAACLEAGVVIVACDRTHTPCGVALPFHAHFRQPAIARAQLDMSEPLKKRLWQAIIQRKIANQAEVLERTAHEEAGALREMVRWVKSGDPDNVEARAARFYWSRLFENFTRADDDDRRNKLLNYGYAIARSAVARALVAVGFLPAFGIGHASETNAFNLADDLVEPFRPLVDRVALELAGPPATWRDALTVADRQAMANVLFANCWIEQQRISLLVAVEMSIASLARAVEQKSVDLLQLPKAINIEGPDLDDD